MEHTQVVRIPLDPPVDLEQRIVDKCKLKYGAGYRLAGCFALQTELILVFQKP
ncbi:MAG: hypothetical protein HZA91_02320 [Verrucomicrobia bacterium]|nr:hypothetical protein [Verrucomicrobiota bacterium]